MTGMELKLRRVAARVRQRDVAQKMGFTRATLTKYEGMEVVPDERAQAYIRAVDELRGEGST